MISSMVASDMTQSQRIVAIHDYLTPNCSYDTGVEANSTPHDTYAAYGALVGQKAVCRGCAVALQLLMQKLEILGIVAQSTTMNHAWNMV